MTEKLTSTSYLRRSAGIARRPAGRSTRAPADALAAPTPKQMHRHRAVRARTVGAYVPALTEKAFDKFGFASVALISEWARIAGPQLAAHTAPERLKWPRPLGKYGDIEDGCEGRPGATLTLRVDPARAFEVEYGRAQLIERINGYFGYRAVEKIKIIQAPLETAAAAPEAAIAPAEPVRAKPMDKPAAEPDSAIGDPALKNALDRLAASIRAA